MEIYDGTNEPMDRIQYMINLSVFIASECGNDVLAGPAYLHENLIMDWFAGSPAKAWLTPLLEPCKENDLLDLILHHTYGTYEGYVEFLSLTRDETTGQIRSMEVV